MLALVFGASFFNSDTDSGLTLKVYSIYFEPNRYDLNDFLLDIDFNGGEWEPYILGCISRNEIRNSRNESNFCVKFKTNIKN